MTSHVRPGRAGRIWLRSHLAVARRSAAMLDRRRQLLLVEAGRRRTAAVKSQAAWEAACADAEVWMRRARPAAGEADIARLTGSVEGKATVRLVWVSVMGVMCADDAVCSLPDAGRVGALGGTAADDVVAVAAGRAVAAAARAAAARQAAAAIEADLLATARRQRMLERRRIPELERELADLELRLDEAERDDRVRSRWIQGRARRSSPTAP